MHRSRSPRPAVISAAVALALIGVLALVASGALGRGPAPSKPLASQPPPSGSPRPVFDFEDGVRIPLQTPEGRRAVYVRDTTGGLIDAVTGHPFGDELVGPRQVRVEQVDARSIRLTWADTADNDAVSLVVSKDGGDYEVEMIRRHVKPDVEIAHNRSVVLTFGAPVAVADVEATIRSSIDTDD